MGPRIGATKLLCCSIVFALTLLPAVGEEGNTGNKRLEPNDRRAREERTGGECTPYRGKGGQGKLSAIETSAFRFIRKKTRGGGTHHGSTRAEMSTMQYDHLVKLLVIGDSGERKTRGAFTKVLQKVHNALESSFYVRGHVSAGGRPTMIYLLLRFYTRFCLLCFATLPSEALIPSLQI